MLLPDLLSSAHTNALLCRAHGASWVQYCWRWATSTRRQAALRGFRETAHGSALHAVSKKAMAGDNVRETAVGMAGSDDEEVTHA